MNILLKEFSSIFLEKILSFLWRFWSLLGIPGYQKTETDRIIDPEALLLFSLAMGRYDARLFDEIIDWVFVNGYFFNVKRLISLQRKYDFSAGPQLSAIAEYLSQNSTYQLKWKKLSHLYKMKKKESFFLFKTGKPIPVGKQLDPIFLGKGLERNLLQIRKHSGLFPQTGTPSLLLRLRALLGINARCELFCVLASMKKIHPAEAARLTGFFQKTVQKALVEMACSGFVQVFPSGREKYYRLKPDVFDSLLFNNGNTPVWISWAPLFKGLELVWRKIVSIQEVLDVLLVASELRRIIRKIEDLFFESTLNIGLMEDSKELTGEKFLDGFMKYIITVSGYLERST